MPCGSGEKHTFDVIDINIHVFSCLSLPLNMWPLISTNMNMALPGMLCLKLGWSWHIGCGDENINIKILKRRFMTSFFKIIPKKIEKKMEFWKVSNRNINDNDIHQPQMSPGRGVLQVFFFLGGGGGILFENVLTIKIYLLSHLHDYMHENVYLPASTFLLYKKREGCKF